MRVCLQMTERERIIQNRKPSLDKSFVPTPTLLHKKQKEPAVHIGHMIAIRAKDMAIIHGY